MNLKNGKVFTSKFIGTGPSSYEKRICRAAVSQRFRNAAADRISWPCSTTCKSLLHCSSVGRNPFFLTTCSFFCLLDASNHTCKPQTSPPYYLWWRILASLVSNMYHSLQQHLISSVRSFWTLSNPKISTSSHGQADSTGNKNIYPLPRSSS